MTEFDRWMTNHQLSWRRQHVVDSRCGTQNQRSYPWILPEELWGEGLWPGIRTSLPAYLASEKVQKHRGVHNLKSSWAACANLYFPFGGPEGRDLLASFLREKISDLVEGVDAVELEYSEPHPLDPRTLFGEPNTGQRGTNQTSPDVAFKVRTTTGKGLILTENKLVEHHFYPCSGQRDDENRDKSRCLHWTKLQADLENRCWQRQWHTPTRKDRRYWNYIRLTDLGRASLQTCPAANDGYQLFRQQALAEAIAEQGSYDLVVSCVAYDARNEALIHCLHSAGVEDFTTGWGALFGGRAKFETFTHQEWVEWVGTHDTTGRWQGWLSYVTTRYHFPR